MPDHDQKRALGQENQQDAEQSNASSSTSSSPAQNQDPYNTDHLPKLSGSPKMLNFKPLDAIRQKASRDRQTLLIIEDGATKTRGWQLSKTEFIQQIDSMVDTKVNGLLKHVGFTTEDCPWLKAFYAELNTYPAQGIEQILRQYLPQGQTVESTDDFLTKLSERIEVPIKHWIKTREIQDVPELVTQKMAETQPGSNTQGHFDPLAAAKQSTSSIPPELAARLEEYLGASLSSIRLHSGSEAQKVLANKKARALTVGQDIYLDLTKYSLQKPEGMAILAHEMQQSGASSMDTANNSDALEADANRSVWALLRRWMQWGQGFSAAGANMKSGLKVAKCGSDKEVEQPLNNYKEQIILPKEKGNFSDNLVHKYFKDRGNVLRMAFHAQGEYNPIQGRHKVYKGNIPNTVALRYYGDYVYEPFPLEKKWKDEKFTKEERALFYQRLGQVVDAISQWNVQTNVGKLFISSSKDIDTGLTNTHTVIVHPFVNRRGDKLYTRSKLPQNLEKKDIKDKKFNNEADYVLKYTNNREKPKNIRKGNENPLQGNFYHIFTSKTMLKNNEGGIKATIEQTVIIDNKSLSTASYVYQDGQGFQQLEHDYQIKDDLLWASVAYFKYRLQQNKNEDKPIPGVGDIQGYYSLLDPTNTAKIKKNELKQWMGDFAEMGSALALLGEMHPAGAILIFFVGYFANHYLDDTIEQNDMVLYASENIAKKLN